ncbi:hypothetical protein ACJX0J_028328, partial [Zea mays]
IGEKMVFLLDTDSQLRGLSDIIRHVCFLVFYILSLTSLETFFHAMETCAVITPFAAQALKGFFYRFVTLPFPRDLNVFSSPVVVLLLIKSEEDEYIMEYLYMWSQHTVIFVKKPSWVLKLLMVLGIPHLQKHLAQLFNQLTYMCHFYF